MAKPRKADIERLQRMLARWDAGEAKLQASYGDVVKGSWRAGQVRNGEALRRLLAAVAGSLPTCTKSQVPEKANV